MVKKLKYLILLALVCVPAMKIQAGITDGTAVYTDADLNRLCIVATAIRFDHKGGSDTDGIDIREDYENDLEHIGNGEGGDGEWRYSGRNEPALYRANKTVTCMVKLQCYGWDNTLEYYAYPITIQVKAVGGIGLDVELKKRSVTFNGATSAWTEFEFTKKTHLWDGDIHQDIEKTEGEFEWFAYDSTGANERTFTGNQKTGPHTFYHVFEDGPKYPWSAVTEKHQPWVSALEFAIVSIPNINTKVKATVIETTTQELFDGFGYKYENEGGEPAFHGTYPAPNTTLSNFELTKYMKADTVLVNCHDQACAVVTLTRLLGVGTRHFKVNKFGFSKTKELVGRGTFNSPFVDPGTWIDKSVTPNVTYTYFNNHNVNSSLLFRDTTPADGVIDRAKFGNHGIATNAATDLVYDATVGPALGTMDFAGYMADTQDVTDPNAGIQAAKVAAAGGTTAANVQELTLYSIK